jgi:hypothetical protein
MLQSAFPDGLAFFPQDKVHEILPATYAVVGTSGPPSYMCVRV